ncbi:MAG: phenylalanine--tRNA ligase subunit alpha [Capsulimonadaceae bacterium]|nr:phenylalanine--tRNA ligase subunit alpha [Capsulimonadaceae bacterium]
MTPTEQLEQIENEGLDAIDSAASLDSLTEVEVAFLGRKGRLTGLLRLISQLSADEKPAFGQAVNAAKDKLTARLTARRAGLSAGERALRLAADALDVTLPGSRLPLGRQHVLTREMDAVKSVLIGLGYKFVETPDVEHYHYNFETLNYPPDHPAFDEQMSFYVEDNYLLRTQTTAFQAHVMEQTKPPIRVATIGKCYRFDAVDATHSHTFHQVDILAVDEGLSLADLKGTFAHLARALFGPSVEIRFRPDFFPFVEPGVEMAIKWGDRWLELGGAGMVHPNILESMGIDSERYTGFAWGLGIERVAMIVHAIDDLRLFTENDLRFLRQF